MEQATKRGRILKREGRRKGEGEPLHLLPHIERREEGGMQGRKGREPYEERRKERQEQGIGSASERKREK